MKDVLLPKESSTILIGPEGDFSFSEIEKSLQKGYTPVTLGKARLRTETAALASVMNVSFINQ
jgi:16S rRNA (uracil1498-N3)-methyltransferase